MLLMLLLLAGFFLIQAGLNPRRLQYVEQKVEIVADLKDVPGAEDALVVHAAATAADISRISVARVRCLPCPSRPRSTQFKARLSGAG